MSHSENQNGVMRYLVAVQSQIAGLSARDDQLANIVFDRPAHERMVRKDGTSIYRGVNFRQLYGGRA